MRRRYFDLCVATSSRTMMAFGNNVSCSNRACSTLALCLSGNIDVNTLASKRSELIGNAEIARMRRVIHNNSTCVCLHLPVAAITQKRKLRPVAPATDRPCVLALVDSGTVPKCGHYRGSNGYKGCRELWEIVVSAE